MIQNHDFDMSAGAALQTASRKRIKAYIFIGATIGAVVMLSTVVQISGAVIAPGTLTAASQTKTISHPTGGTLAQILVSEGQAVKRGDVLLEFETGVTTAAAERSGENLSALAARRDRLEAELAGVSKASFGEPAATGVDPAMQESIARERKLFEARQAGAGAQIGMLLARRRQLEAEIVGLRSRISSLRRQRVLLAPELSGLRRLYNEELVTINRLNEIERSDVGLRGEIGTLEANIVQSQARISEIDREIVFNKQNMRSLAGQELNQVVSDLGEGHVRRVNAYDVLDRSKIRAPQDGLVDSIAFITPGSAVPPGQPILRIVPSNDNIIADIRVNPSDVDQIKVGQQVTLKFSTIQASQTPEFDGTVTFLSPDLAEDTRTGQPYYRVRVSTINGKFEKNDIKKMAIGMPVEAYIQTGNISFIGYIFKPLMDQIGKAFKQ